MDIPGLGIDKVALNKKALPKIKAKVESLNLNESERKQVMKMLALFNDSHNLHMLGMAYLNTYENQYRGEGPQEERRMISCPACGAPALNLPHEVVEVFRRPVHKGDSAYGRYMDAPKINRAWNEIDVRGNNKKVYAEYRAIVLTHICSRCNNVFSYPNIRLATTSYFKVETVSDAAEKIANKFDGRIIKDGEQPQNY